MEMTSFENESKKYSPWKIVTLILTVIVVILVIWLAQECPHCGKRWSHDSEIEHPSSAVINSSTIEDMEEKYGDKIFLNDSINDFWQRYKDLQPQLDAIVDKSKIAILNVDSLTSNDDVFQQFNRFIHKLEKTCENYKGKLSSVHDMVTAQKVFDFVLTELNSYKKTKRLLEEIERQQASGGKVDINNLLNGFSDEKLLTIPRIKKLVDDLRRKFDTNYTEITNKLDSVEQENKKLRIRIKENDSVYSAKVVEKTKEINDLKNVNKN